MRPRAVQSKRVLHDSFADKCQLVDNKIRWFYKCSEILYDTCFSFLQNEKLYLMLLAS